MYLGERLINVTKTSDAFTNLLLQDINTAEQPTPNRGRVPHRQTSGQTPPPCTHPWLIPLVRVLHPQSDQMIKVLKLYVSSSESNTRLPEPVTVDAV